MADFFGGGFIDDSGEGVGVFLGGLFEGADAAEVLDEAVAGDGADAGDVVEFAGAVAHLATLAVVGDGEAVAFVADFLDDVEDGAAAVEDDGVVFLSVDVDDLFAFGDGGEGLSGEADLFERVGCGVELAEAAVDEHQRGHRFVVFLEALVSAVDDLAHGGEVVDAGDGFDLELAVVGLLHGALFPDDHGGYGFGPLDVGDVEALDAFGGLGEHEGVLEGFLHVLDAGLKDAEALVVGLLGVLADEIDEGALVAALGGGDLDFFAAALAEGVGEKGAVGEVDGDVDVFGDVGLVEVHLLEEGGEEDGGGEDGGLWAVEGFEDGGLVGRGCVLDVGGGRGGIGFEGGFGIGIVGLGEIDGVEFGEFLPEEFAAVDDLAGAHVEEVDGEHVVFVVEAEDVGVFVVG